MTKPIIAITAESLVKPSPVLSENFADYAPRDVKEAILAAGGIPIILPFPEDIAQAKEIAEAAVKIFDGLLIPGGPDVDPTLYGEEPIMALGRTAYQRDHYEVALVKAAAAAGKPILGICRGIQLINVAFGGNLYQDLVTQNHQVRLKHSQNSWGSFPTHHVNIAKDSRLFSSLGTRAYVNSRHHQAIKKVADNFKVVAKAPDDVIEAIESEDGNVLAVQWHPENLWQKDAQELNFFKEFVEQCAEKAGKEAQGVN